MSYGSGYDNAADGGSRSSQLDQVLAGLLSRAPEVEAAAVVSFDGLPMASALPAGMDEDRVAAMSAALLSLGERAAQGLGRGDLNQVYVEGESGTVFLVAAEDEAVLVAVGARGAKVGLVLFEVRQAADAVAGVLRTVDVDPEPRYEPVAPTQEQVRYDAVPTAQAPVNALVSYEPPQPLEPPLPPAPEPLRQPEYAPATARDDDHDGNQFDGSQYDDHDYDVDYFAGQRPEQDSRSRAEEPVPVPVGRYPELDDEDDRYRGNGNGNGTASGNGAGGVTRGVAPAAPWPPQRENRTEPSSWS